MKEKRRIDLPMMAVGALHVDRKALRADGLAGSEWKVSNTKGEFCTATMFLYRSFKPLLTKAGLPAGRFRDLRHTAATFLSSQRVHPKVIQEMIGHSISVVTLDTYSHVLQSMHREAADKM